MAALITAEVAAAMPLVVLLKWLLWLQLLVLLCGFYGCGSSCYSFAALTAVMAAIVADVLKLYP